MVSDFLFLDSIFVLYDRHLPSEKLPGAVTPGSSLHSGRSYFPIASSRNRSLLRLVYHKRFPDMEPQRSPLAYTQSRCKDRFGPSINTKGTVPTALREPDSVDFEFRTWAFDKSSVSWSFSRRSTVTKKRFRRQIVVRNGAPGITRKHIKGGIVKDMAHRGSPPARSWLIRCRHTVQRTHL
jgi:hypothetical protein